MERKYTWYVESIAQTVNETASREMPETDAQRSEKCADGVKRNLWLCSQGYSFITKLKGMGLRTSKDFNIYVQEGKGFPKIFFPKKGGKR